ncbi:MAG: long-chain fatty acid--CoA ligase [bacterium]
MQGLMMDYPLTLTTIMRRAEFLFRNQEIVTRQPDKSYHRYTYADWINRTKKLALALKRVGVKAGERVATFCWNHYQHHELYYGIPAMGGVLHTLNLRLGPEDLAYIVEHAGDKVLVIDDNLLPLYDSFKDKVRFEHVIVISRNGQTPEGMLNYEELLEGEDANQFEYTDWDENNATAMCYTSGTTGRPKGVVYSHRSMVLHSMAGAMTATLGTSDSDVILPVVPMFHVNAWGIPFTAVMCGTKLVYPGPHLDPLSLLEAYAAEKVTITAGVPTIWFGMLEILDKNPSAYDLSSMRTLVVGGAAAPKSMIQGFERRHNLKVVHAWGMTETSPLGTISNMKNELKNLSSEAQYDFRAKQGVACPMVELRVRGEEGLAPFDGQSMGELEIRGPWIASAYYKSEDSSDKFTEDGWFKTGDIATIDEHGYMEIKDRSKDLVKSGGEWISSVDLENTLMGHESVAEAAVIAVPHPKWQERPLAVVVLAAGKSASKDELTEFLAKSFPKWWLPDAVVFVKEIPKTSVGKFKKSELRETFKEHLMGEK